MAGPSTFDPANLKVSQTVGLAGADLKQSLVTDAYTSGTPGAGDLKPALLKANGDLKEALLDGSDLKISLGTPAATSALLLETGDALLLETGDGLLLE